MKSIENNRKIEPIKLHPVEMQSEMAICIAHCIGATYENDEEISNTITYEEIIDCIDYIRKRMSGIVE